MQEPVMYRVYMTAPDVLEAVYDHVMHALSSPVSLQDIGFGSNTVVYGDVAAELVIIDRELLLDRAVTGMPYKDVAEIFTDWTRWRLMSMPVELDE